MTPKPVTLHQPQLLVGRLGYFSCLQDRVVPTLHVLQLSRCYRPSSRGRAQTLLLEQDSASKPNPAVPRGDTDSVTSAPLHPVHSTDRAFLLCICSVWIIPLPPGSPKMTAINPDFPHVPRELHYPNPPQLPTMLRLPR